MILWVVALFAIGVALIFTEFFMPGLVLGSLGCISIIASVVLAFVHLPDQAWYVLGAELIGIAGTVALGMYVMQRTRLGGRMVLQAGPALRDGWVAAESDETLVGALGEVHTALRPAGTIVVGERRISAVSRGDFIEEGALVRVTEVQGNRVVVEAAKPE